MPSDLRHSAGNRSVSIDSDGGPSESPPEAGRRPGLLVGWPTGPAGRALAAVWNLNMLSEGPPGDRQCVQWPDSPLAARVLICISRSTPGSCKFRRPFE